MVSLAILASDPIPASDLAHVEASKLHGAVYDLICGRGVFAFLSVGQIGKYASAIRFALNPSAITYSPVQNRAESLLLARSRTEPGVVMQLIFNRYKPLCGPWHTAYRQAVKELCPTFGTKREALRELIRAGEYGFLCSTPAEREARQPKPQPVRPSPEVLDTIPFDSGAAAPLYSWPGVNPPESVREEIEHVCACMDAEEAERFDGLS